jgi:predicted esterase
LENDPLKTAIDLIHSGQTQSAQKVLQSILKADAHNIPAWFWYVETCSTMEQRLQILEACSICNPDNPQVKSVLDVLRKPQVRPSEISKTETKPPDDESKHTDKNVISTGVAQSLQKPVAVEPKDEKNQRVQRPVKKSQNAGALILWLIAGVFVVLFALLAVYLIDSTPADPTSHRFTQPIEYYLYVPKAYEPSRAWPLFIGIHGSGGTGLDCWNLWQPYAEREGFILLCPTMPDEGGGWLQTDGEKYTWAAISQVTGQYNIRPRYFLAGFSAGAAFVQGFCLHYPQSVEAVAVLSAGDYYIPFPLMGAGTPFLIVIGDLDNPDSISGSKQFAQALTNNGIAVNYWLLPGVGHQVTDRTKQLTIDFYRAVNK